MKIQTRKFVFVVPVAAIVLAAGCTSHGGKAQAEKSNLHAVASSSAVQADVAKGKQIVTGCVTSTHTIKGFKTCLEDAVPAGQRQALKSCLVKAGLADHLTTKPGRRLFEQTSAPLCVGAAVTTGTPAPKASH